ncbi:skin secretory protein xP2-like [Vulpes lagopus]|uniref:skin secretory protein xP2-like n=1 Tax=Vulpes lagopus TaxID=494514 RepID=UPI001BCA390A|nr:skin secretory protein xP2-like [Vulpes lagopus]
MATAAGAAGARPVTTLRVRAPQRPEAPRRRPAPWSAPGPAPARAGPMALRGPAVGPPSPSPAGPAEAEGEKLEGELRISKRQVREIEKAAGITRSGPVPERGDQHHELRSQVPAPRPGGPEPLLESPARKAGASAASQPEPALVWGVQELPRGTTRVTLVFSPSSLVTFPVARGT